MGVGHAVLWTDASKSSAEYYRSRKEHFAALGIDVYGFGNADVHNQDAIVLGTAERDAKIEEYKRHLQSLGAAGIPYTTYAHMANGIWSTDREKTRGGADARALDMASPEATGRWHDRAYTLPLTNEREYSEAELWDNFTYFIRRAAPRRRERRGDDRHPPGRPARADRDRAACRASSAPSSATSTRWTIADSPNVGVCLCVGCWLEGGELMGATPDEAIRNFGEQQKLFKVHFRNVDQPLPHFVETFIDDGYKDMYLVMKALQDVGFKGVVIPDHIPRMAGDGSRGTAFTIGYMKALLARAEAEAEAGAR